MSRIKKIAISILTGIMVIFGLHSMSSAYYVGQNLTVTYNSYISSNNIFCVEHYQSLTANNNYEVVSNIKIEGTKSTDHEGKSIEARRNAKFAYILSANNGSNHDAGPVQNAVWNYGYIWLQHVGQYHAGIGPNFMSSVGGNHTEKTTDLIDEAQEYAENIGNGTNVTDNTNKNNIKVEAHNKDGKQYIRVGPLNWTFAGKLTEISVYDQNSKALSGNLYSTFSGNTENWINVENITSGKDFYISIPADSGVSKITKITGNLEVNVKAVNMWFLKSTTGYKQNLIVRDPYTATDDIDISFDYDISILGNLKVIKVNKDNEIVKLPGVGFYIQNKDIGKYVKQATDGTITYVDNKEQATEFITDANGEILIKDLIVGTYVAYETKNPNYGYEIIQEGQQKNVVVDKTEELKIPNKQKYVKLSGYVWVDKIDEKQSVRNDLFKDSNYDTSDMLLDGIKVRLKDKTTGETIKEATTANGGAYKFIDVLVDDLGNYYIEFEYDGLTYTNVVPNINKDNGSKSAENSTVRENFNKDFSVIEGKTDSTGVTKDSDGNEKHTLTYNLDKNKHTATLDKTVIYPITANTEETGYNIKAKFIPGQEEVKYINLGLYEREQPDIALLKDLENVKVSINGYNHVYKYAQRINNAGVYEQGFNVGVKFATGKEDTYGNMSYSRAVYKADYEYTNEHDNSKELKVYATYRIRMKNESSNLQVSVNSIADYYDSRYTITKAGTGLDEEENPKGDISYTDPTIYNDKYQKTIINTNTTKIAKGEYVDIYVQFELDREDVTDIMDDIENLNSDVKDLNNVAEINSYSVFDENGAVYAGVDVDSNPGNAVPRDKTTYEDDTDSAPGLRLEVTNAREMAGTVFLDSTSNELRTGEVRQGDGEYKESEENGIAGVEVTLKDSEGNIAKYYDEVEKVWKEAKTSTNSEGTFLISGFIPGDYTLTYTWGDTTYTVQNYKGTIYKDKDRANNAEWYKITEPRYSDAIDDYQLRQKIDDEINNQETTVTNKMDSTTPIMVIGVEYETVYTASKGDRYTYRINNIDFGIVERARQDVTLEKRVKTFKVTLANGQVIADVTIDENGNMTGEKNHVTYMGPSLLTMPNNGFVKLELDSELMQGATVEVEYEIKAINNSELEYLSENFYKYGIIEGSLVTITPTAIIDYLDKDWAFDAEKNTAWEIKTVEEIKDIVAETVYNDENSTIDNKIILYTESLSSQKLEPTKSATVSLKVSKILANSDEIAIDNETEITKVQKTGGSKLDSTPGNYVPGTGHTESDDNMSETVIVTPSTGDNLDFILPITVGVIALAILAIGVVIIKKKTL